MFRLNLVGVVLTLLATLSSSPARADDWEEDYGQPAARGNGDVQVELAGSTPGLTYDVFRSTLSPYGEWYASARYGNVWRPRVAVGWRPYYYGSWAWTNEGWYWDSAEPFAWATYHYGRWVYDPSWGWVWVPGYEWAPAWVTWRYGADVVGWAPLGPGVSVFVTAYPFVDFWWTFVPCTQFVGVPVYRVAYSPRETPRWFGGTAPAPPRTTALASPRAGAFGPAPAWGGPTRTFVEQRIGRPLAVERPAPTWQPQRGAEGARPPAEQRPDAWRGPREGPPAVQRPDAWRGPREQPPAARPPAREEGGRPGGWSAPPRGESRPQGGGRPEGNWSAPPRGEPQRAAPAPSGGGRHEGGGRGDGGGGGRASGHWGR